MPEPTTIDCERAIESYQELIAIIRDNGWTGAHATEPNSARLS